MFRNTPCGPGRILCSSFQLTRYVCWQRMQDLFSWFQWSLKNHFLQSCNLLQDSSRLQVILKVRSEGVQKIASVKAGLAGRTLCTKGSAWIVSACPGWISPSTGPNCSGAMFVFCRKEWTNALWNFESVKTKTVKVQGTGSRSDQDARPHWWGNNTFFHWHHWLPIWHSAIRIFRCTVSKNGAGVDQPEAPACDNQNSQTARTGKL